MFKPDAVANGHAGKILDQIIQAGFKVVALKYTQLSNERAGDFYGIHRERPFFSDLVSFMTSGPIYAGTIRNLFAKSIDANAIHGSDSDENAEIEGNFFFAADERF